MKKLFVLMVAVMALVAFSAPAWAADTVPGPSVTVNGRILTDLGYQNLSKELTTNKKDDVTTAFINVAGHSYLRGVFTSADKTTGGFIELGLASKLGSSETTSLRYAYGWWKVGNCRLLAGHTDGWLGSLAYHPKQYLGVSQDAKLLLGQWGYKYSGRHPQVRFEYMAGNFGFSLAVVQPAAEVLPTVTGADTYASLPRFDLAFDINFGGLKLMPAFGISQVKFQGVPSGYDDNVTTWIAMLPFKFTMGPFTAKFQAYTGNNLDIEYSGNLLAATQSFQRSLPAYDSKGKVQDTKETGGFLSFEYQIGQLELVAGYGMVKVENDLWKKSNGYAKEDNTRNAWFVAFPYQITKNFSIHPEFSYYNYGDLLTTGKEAGNEWLMGVQFRFVF